jgi:hypothetical protein
VVWPGTEGVPSETLGHETRNDPRILSDLRR